MQQRYKTTTKLQTEEKSKQNNSKKDHHANQHR
jgi:hypothetical protein